MKTYNYLFVELSVPLTREWPLISSPFPILLIILGYLYFVLYAGPRYMKNRPPYKLKTFILFYNIIQIFANLWIIREHIASDYLKEYSITCPLVFHSTLDSPKLLRLYNSSWWLFMLKIFDLVETCIFVLRKKQNQVSTLHVYHHVSNTFFIWMYLKYVLEVKVSRILFLNCIVHVIMYTYYFISANRKYQQIMSPLKPFITRIQMVQFVVMILYVLQGMHPACQATLSFYFILSLLLLFIGNLLIFLYLFYDFYKKTYTNMKSKMN